MALRCSPAQGNAHSRCEAIVTPGSGGMGLRRFGAFCSLLFVLFSCALVEAGKDYYKILQISRGADDATIKKAYKRMALCAANSTPQDPTRLGSC